jgi:hypothetical protein
MFGLHYLMQLAEHPNVTSSLWMAACRAALVAADAQRDTLGGAENRWALQAQREEIYAAAVRAHAEASAGSAVAHIIEIGRADLLNHILSTGTVLPAGAHSGSVILTDFPIVPPPVDPELVEHVYRVAAAAVGALGAEGPSEVPVQLPPLPGPGPADAELDGCADVVATIHLGRYRRGGWWSAVAWRAAGSAWGVAVRDADGAVARILDTTAAGGFLPSRGTSVRTWEQLGDFLLPGDELWAGTPDSPRSVALCPDPRLWQIPYPALRRGGVYLTDIAEVTLVPSLRTLLLLHRRRDQRISGQGGGVGSSAAGPAVSMLDVALPGHEQERAALDAWAAGYHPIDDLDLLVEAAKSASVLYISGHSADLGESAMLGTKTVTMSVLASHSLPPLLFLNGCWSGTAASRYGRDPLSLALGGLAGGADTVIAGVGRIGSVASADVAERTLHLIQAGRAPGSTLREAQRATRDRHPELGPMEWASLCAVGTGM